MDKHIIRVDAKVQWLGGFDKVSKHYVAHCPALKLTASGITWSEMTEVIRETMDLFFSVLLKNNELEDFLKEQGWQTHEPMPSSKGRMQVDVPWTVKKTNHHDQTALAA